MQGICLCVLVLATSFGFDAIIPVVPRSEFRHVYPLNSEGRVVIQNFYGNVRIAAWDRNVVEVNAIKTGADTRGLDDARVVVDSDSPDLVSIRTQYGGGEAEHPAYVEYRIWVPRHARLEEIQLVNGQLSLSGLAGPVKAASVNGDIKAEKLGGQVDLSTVNGKLDVDFERISRTNPISLSSINGSINLSIPSGSGVSLVAENLSGGIESDIGGAAPSTDSHRLRAQVHGGGAPIRVNNKNGGISIRSTWSKHSERASFRQPRAFRL